MDNRYPNLQCLTEVTIGFNPTTYSVSEDVGSVNVAVSLLSGILARNVTVSLRTRDGTAVGESLNKCACILTRYAAILLKLNVFFLNTAGMDFSNTSNDLMLSPSSTTQTVMVSILNDAAAENLLEYFILVLMSTDPAVSLNPMIANITIIDDSDGKYP